MASRHRQKKFLISAAILVVPDLALSWWLYERNYDTLGAV